MKFTKLFIALLFLSIFAVAFLPQSSGYLQNKTNGAPTDTIATASSNDTSYTFQNVGYTSLNVQLKQNSFLQQFNIKSPSANLEFRVRYVAADTALIVEKPGLFGWVPIPIINTTGDTTRMYYPLTKKTGTGIFAIEGTK